MFEFIDKAIEDGKIKIAEEALENAGVSEELAEKIAYTEFSSNQDAIDSSVVGVVAEHAKDKTLEFGSEVVGNTSELVTSGFDSAIETATSIDISDAIDTAADAGPIVGALAAAGAIGAAVYNYASDGEETDLEKGSVSAEDKNKLGNAVDTVDEVIQRNDEVKAAEFIEEESAFEKGEGSLKLLTNTMRTVSTVVDNIPIPGIADLGAAGIRGAAGALDSAMALVSGDTELAAQEAAAGIAETLLTAAPLVEKINWIPGVNLHETAREMVGNAVGDMFEHETTDITKDEHPQPTEIGGIEINSAAATEISDVAEQLNLQMTDASNTVNDDIITSQEVGKSSQGR